MWVYWILDHREEYCAGPAIKAAIAPETAVAIRAPIRDEEGRLLPLAQPLKVCLMSADFPGLPNAGHISTAFTLLAAALGTDPSLKVISPMPSSPHATKAGR